ncbi:MAG: hypothetical protein JXB32_19625, partial [Deltaproteobacteria bacterium]|nr:hypothetical protein [Deltaproteobacteria bacterium]
RFKIYIIDEVHMLSGSAFNALLKTLEEPPPHVKFVFATTEPHKIPVTILSRCQRYDFRRIATRLIAGRIEQILADEAIALEPAAVRVLADEAGGSMRDALSLLDQVLAAFPDGAKAADVTWLLGVTPQALLHRVAAAVVDHDARAALEAVREADDAGHDLQQFARSFLHYLRDLLVLASCADAHGLTELADAEERAARDVVERTTVPHLHRLFALASHLLDELARSPLPRVHVDVALARMATADTVLPIADILARLERLPSGRDPAGPGSPARPPVGRGTPPAGAPSRGVAPARATPPPPELDPPDSDSTPPGPPTRGSDADAAVPPDEPEPAASSSTAAPPTGRGSALGWDVEPIRPATPVPPPPTPPTPPAAPPSPPRTTAAAGVSALPPDAWNRVVEELARVDRVLAGLLAQAVPVELTPELVRLAFPEDSTAAGLLRQPKRAESLIAAADRVLGGRPRVEVDDASSDAAKAIADRLAARHAAEARVRQEIMDHPTVREALQTFPGSRVVEVRAGTPGATKGARLR